MRSSFTSTATPVRTPASDSALPALAAPEPAQVTTCDALMKSNVGDADSSPALEMTAVMRLLSDGPSRHARGTAAVAPVLHHGTRRSTGCTRLARTFCIR